MDFVKINKKFEKILNLYKSVNYDFKSFGIYGFFILFGLNFKGKSC